MVLRVFGRWLFYGFAAAHFVVLFVGESVADSAGGSHRHHSARSIVFSVLSFATVAAGTYLQLSSDSHWVWAVWAVALVFTAVAWMRIAVDIVTESHARAMLAREHEKRGESREPALSNQYR